MFDLLTDLAEHETVVMVWEDLHEADSDSVALLMRLARLLAHTRVLVIATTAHVRARTSSGSSALSNNSSRRAAASRSTSNPSTVPTSAPSLPTPSVRCPKGSWST